MDGRASGMSRSLQARLSLALTATILLVAVGAGCFGFISAYRDSIRMQDDMLRQVGALIARMDGTLPETGAVGRYPGGDHESRIAVQWLPSADDPAPSQGRPPLPLPADLHDGLQTVFMYHENFRVYVQALESGRRIALSQETDVRDHIAYRSAWRALIPVLILVPVLLLALQRIIGKLFAPLQTLRRDIDQRRDDQLEPIATTALPAEILPFVEAINRLLARVQGALRSQRRFVADAAHELRTPLAALSLQAERLQQSEMSDTARERLLRLGSGIDRSKALVAQMLALARAQGGESAGSAGSAESSQRSRFVLKDAVRPVLEDLLPLAQQKEIDLGVDSPLEVEVCSRPLELGLLLSNLIDNAVRYTPPGGRVGIAVTSNAQAGRVRLEITDTGPGIPAAQRERVFEPFYRIDPGAAPGSGLGLSIVQSIAARLDIDLRLEHADAASSRGLRVILDIPAAEGLPGG